MRKLARLRLIVGMSLLLALASIEAAFAHAQLLGTNPADGAVVSTAPAELSLHFNEPVTPLAIRLVRPDGTSEDLLGATTDGETVTVELPPGAPAGTHVLSWRVVSTDGHPIGGSLVFSIGEATGAAMVETTADRATSVALWSAKAVLFITLFAGVGGAVFRSIVESPAPSRNTAVALSTAGILVAPLTLGLQGLDALGLPIASFFDAAAWSTGLATSYGGTAVATTVGCALSMVALLLPRGLIASIIGAGAGALAALAFALSGHASAAAPQWLTRPAVFLHIAGILFWAGALLPLWLALRERSAKADRALAGFSRVIPFAVAPLVLSGLTLAVIQLGLPGPQWVSPYGTILAVKLGLLVVLFALALWNRRWLTAPALAGKAIARQRLRRSIGIEMLIVVAILCLVAGWRFTPPPRALADAVGAATAAEPVLLHAMDGRVMAMVAVTPGSPGPVVLHIQLTDPAFVPIEAQDVSISLSSPTLGIERLERDAAPTAAGWEVRDLTIPMAGTWVLELDIRLSRFELTKLRSQFTIR